MTAREAQGRPAGIFEIFLLVVLAAALSATGCDSDPTPLRPGEAPAMDLAPPSPTPADNAPPRAIILISLDTLRADHLGIYGHSRFTSPVLDQFGREGAVFEDASAPSPWTLPSHASMLSGLSPASHGLKSSERRLSDDVKTLAGFFADAGWETSAIVNSLYLKRKQYGITREFEDSVEVDRHPASIQPSKRITDETRRRLLDQGRRPLFLFVHYFDIHADYASLPIFEDLMVTPYEGKADGSSWQLRRANFSDEHVEGCIRDFTPLACDYGAKSGKLRIDASMERVTYEASDIRHLEELYDAGVRQTDTEVGVLLNYIDEIGRAGDTVVVITSDHGEEFKEHGRVDHFLTMFQESLRVPLLIRGPGIPRGERFSGLVSLVDIAPTLLSLAHVPVPTNLDGVDLTRLWREPDATDLSQRVLFGEASGGLEYHRWFPGVYPIYRSVRRGPLKLIERVWDGEIVYMLYDLEKDPGEFNDVSRENPVAVAELRALLDARKSAEVSPPSGGEAEVSAEEIEQLRALGYVP